MRELLVTGATGFVGRNLLIRAALEGVPVLAPVRDPGKLERCLKEDGVPSGMVHALPPDPSQWTDLRPSHAVLAAGVLFARKREEYFATNLDWTTRVFAALPPDCRTVVLSSQSAGGPTPAGRTARVESDAGAPVTWYGESKLALEKNLAREFPSRPYRVLRPPMILGARDSATWPLFKMAESSLRVKPGLRRKFYSWIAVEDVVRAILAAFELDEPGPFQICAPDPISDTSLIELAAAIVGRNGLTLRLPWPAIRLFSIVVDTLPPLRRSLPSLTRDRVREIAADRWVLDSSAFRQRTGWETREPIRKALEEAWNYFNSPGFHR